MCVFIAWIIFYPIEKDYFPIDKNDWKLLFIIFHFQQISFYLYSIFPKMTFCSFLEKAYYSLIFSIIHTFYRYPQLFFWNILHDVPFFFFFLVTFLWQIYFIFTFLFPYIILFLYIFTYFSWIFTIFCTLLLHSYFIFMTKSYVFLFYVYLLNCYFAIFIHFCCMWILWITLWIIENTIFPFTSCSHLFFSFIHFIFYINLFFSLCVLKKYTSFL